MGVFFESMNKQGEKVEYQIPYERDIWFSPAKVLSDFSSLSEQGKQHYSPNEQKVIDEAVKASIMLLGIMEGTHREYWLQLVNPTEKQPDIRTMYTEAREGMSDFMHYQDVEVTEYGEHSFESLADFLKRTKLSQKKAYPTDTIILCRVTKTMQKPDWASLNQELQETQSLLNVYVSARTSPTEQNYSLVHVYPQIEPFVHYNAIEAAKKWCRTGVRKLRRGTKKENRHNPDEKHFPFWQLKILKILTLSAILSGILK